MSGEQQSGEGAEEGRDAGRGDERKRGEEQGRMKGDEELDKCEERGDGSEVTSGERWQTAVVCDEKDERESDGGKENIEG